MTPSARLSAAIEVLADIETRKSLLYMLTAHIACLFTPGLANDYKAKLETDIAEQKNEIERLGALARALAEPKAAFDLLPERVRNYLLRRAVRARS